MPTPIGERRCLCAKQHTPQVDPHELERHHVWPLGKGGPDIDENLLWLCASMHNQVHRLWRYSERYDGPPPTWILKHFSRYARKVVAEGWAQMKGL